VLLSLDFPSESRAMDCYKLSEDFRFRLEAEKKRVVSGNTNSSTLAIAVSTYGSHDVVAVLCRDGISSNLTNFRATIHISTR
jgi:hypothetical protein